MLANYITENLLGELLSRLATLWDDDSDALLAVRVRIALRTSHYSNESFADYESRVR